MPVSSILAIGDGPETDIRGAAGQGIACVFMTGLHDGEGSLADDDAAIRKAVPEASILRTVERLDW